MSLHQWALDWGVSAPALQDLQHRLGLLTPAIVAAAGAPPDQHTEAYVQSLARVEASNRGIRVFRNNVGALKDEDGRVVRYGFANDSKALNAVIKSSDLGGWRPILITPQMVGTRVAQSWWRECKAPGWQYTGTGREVAQKAWIDAVNADGGDAAFLTDPKGV